MELVRLGEWKVVEAECEEPDYCERKGDCGDCEAVTKKVDCEIVRGVKTCTAPYQVGEPWAVWSFLELTSSPFRTLLWPRSRFIRTTA